MSRSKEICCYNLTQLGAHAEYTQLESDSTALSIDKKEEGERTYQPLLLDTSDVGINRWANIFLKWL